MPKINKVRLIVYLPRGFAVALKAIAVLTGEASSEIAKRLLADSIKSEASALLVMTKLLAYGQSNNLFPASVASELMQLESDRRNLDAQDIEVEIEE